MSTVYQHLVPRRGSEAARQGVISLTTLVPNELYYTLDGKNFFVGEERMTPCHRSVADETVRLALYTTALKCRVGDYCVETASNRAYLCIANNGSSATDWRAMDADLSGVSGVALSGHTAVTFNSDKLVVYAQPGDDVAGILVHSYDINAVVEIFNTGTITESSWTWEVNKLIFLAENGVLTQVVPESGFENIIGRAISATSIFLQIEPPTNL